MNDHFRFWFLAATFIASMILGIVCAPLGARADDGRLRLVDSSTDSESLLPPGLEPPSDLRPQSALEWYLFYSAVAFRRDLKQERARAERLQQDLVECNTVRSVMENEPDPAPPAGDRSLIQVRGFDWTAFAVGAGVGGAATAAAILAIVLAAGGGS